jgi:hypothetical protein
MHAQVEWKCLREGSSTPREQTCARTATTADSNVDSINRKSLRCFTRVLELNTKHDCVLRVASCERIIQAWIGVGGIEQDIRDKNSTHAHAEGRDNGKRAAERFAERGSSNERGHRDRTTEGGRVRRKCKFLSTSPGTNSCAGEGKGGKCVCQARHYMG